MSNGSFGSNGPLDILPLPSHRPATCMGSMPTYDVIRDNLLNAQPNVQWTYTCPLDPMDQSNVHWTYLCPLDILQRYWTLINYIVTVNGDRRKSPGIKRRKPNTNFFCFCKVQFHVILRSPFSTFCNLRR